MSKEVNKVPDYSLQKMFDIAVRHLMGMKERSGVCETEGHFSCLYRGPNGGKCAVGVLIPDNIYDEQFDVGNISASELCYRYKNIFEPWSDKIDFLSRLQAIHDTRVNWLNGKKYMIEELFNLAAYYDLDDSVLTPYKAGQ